jgi:hypothetical protein
MSPAPAFSTLQAATPQEAAAIAVAVEQFRRDTASPAPADAPEPNAWHRAALLEGTGRDPDAPSPWGAPVPWG